MICTLSIPRLSRWKLTLKDIFKLHLYRGEGFARIYYLLNYVKDKFEYFFKSHLFKGERCAPYLLHLEVGGG